MPLYTPPPEEILKKSTILPPLYPLSSVSLAMSDGSYAL